MNTHDLAALTDPIDLTEVYDLYAARLAQRGTDLTIALSSDQSAELVIVESKGSPDFGALRGTTPTELAEPDHLPEVAPELAPDRQGDILITRTPPVPVEAARQTSGRPFSGLGDTNGFITITAPDELFARRGANSHVLVPINGCPVHFRRKPTADQLVWTVVVPEGSAARLEHWGRRANHRPMYLAPGSYELAGKVGAVFGICD